MIETFYGRDFLGLGILIDQLGSYFVLSTLGILAASLYSSGHSISAQAVIRKIVLFTPFQAFVIALLLMPFEYPIWLDDLLRRLGATLIPIALVSVGHQLQLSHVRGKVSALTIGLVQARARSGIDPVAIRANAAIRLADAKRNGVRGRDGPNDWGKHRRLGSRT
jgi:malate permease and related proteins